MDDLNQYIKRFSTESLSDYEGLSSDDDNASI